MAAALVGGALLSAFLQVAFDRLASPQVLDFFRRRKLDGRLLKKLERKLRSIDALADDAEQQQFRNQRVKAWLVDVKEAVFEAEDLLDEIYELSKSEAEAESHNSTDNKVQNLNFFISSVSFFKNENEIETRMTQVLDDLDELEKQGDRLGLKEASGVGVGSGSGSEVPQKSQSTYVVVESAIYGRDEDKGSIFDWLTSDPDNHNKLSILSIVGMGGLGKTVLAQHAYNDPRIESKFDIKAWVCVSDDFSVFNVTRSILEAITKSTDDSRSLQLVHERLEVNLKGKKFLLVLDDVWNEKRNEWEAVQTPLINFGAHGSKILVTTRSKKVASTMRSEEHYLEQLHGDSCWQLFTEHAFQDNNAQTNQDFKGIGMQIVKKCKGLPLALKTMGSLLRSKSSVSEWESILKSEIWELEDSDIIPALALSYHHLPSHLKRCFAFCALFPKDYEFDKECLIQLWMAENFLQCHQQNKSAEEVGEQYFNDLLSRSFFQPSSRHGKRFVMHDLLNDLAKYVSEDICFRFGVDKAKDISKTTRHFSIATNHTEYFDGFESLLNAERLHTFMPTYGYSWPCKMSIRELFSKFNFLRVLSLSEWLGLTEVPNSIGNLKYLRSLDLSYTDIEYLPDSTCSLSNLQILKLSYCGHLKELPSNLHILTNLRHLELIDTGVRKVPAHLGELKNLKVLMSSFNVGKSRESGIQQLGELDLHGNLSIGDLQNIEKPSDALAADLKKKTHLVKLKLEWDVRREWNPDDSMKERDSIENLQPSKHLKKLKISNYNGAQFPNWLFNNSLSNMMSLYLFNCGYCLCLASFGHLPFLKKLTIDKFDGIVSIDANFYGNSSPSFVSLETLKIHNMKEWKEWECQSVGAFPRLRRLHISYCPKLRGHLPEQLPHLRDLFISDCEQLEASAPRAPEIHELSLSDCGNLQFHYHPTTLKSLNIRGHNMESSLLEKIGHIISDNSLEHLDVESCPNMNIPMSRCYDSLVELTINDSCDSITTFSLDFFSELKSLILKRCRNLKIISQEHAQDHLKHLKISNCLQFESLPERMHVLLPLLDKLQIEDCPKVESFFDGSLPSNLKKLCLNKCSKLITSLKGALSADAFLEILHVGKLEVESFPNEGLLRLSLTSLRISKCPDLKSLDYKGLCSLSSLKELVIEDCPKLECLPEEGLPKSISKLTISGNCPLLKQRCQKPEGEDCGKIAHIEQVDIKDALADWYFGDLPWQSNWFLDDLFHRPIDILTTSGISHL